MLQKENKRKTFEAFYERVNSASNFPNRSSGFINHIAMDHTRFRSSRFPSRSGPISSRPADPSRSKPSKVTIADVVGEIIGVVFSFLRPLPPPSPPLLLMKGPSKCFLVSGLRWSGRDTISAFPQCGTI